MQSYAKPEFVTARCDGDDYAALVACWDKSMVITEDFEFVLPEKKQVRTLEGYTDVLMHLSVSMPVTYDGGVSIGVIPAHITKLTSDSITIRDARSPYTEYAHVPMERLCYRMNYETVLPSGNALECTIDTLHRVAKHDGLKLVTNPKYMDNIPYRFWVVPRTSEDTASRIIKTFEPGRLWTKEKRATSPLSNTNAMKKIQKKKSKKNGASNIFPNVDLPGILPNVVGEKNEPDKMSSPIFFDLNDSDSE